MNNLRAQIQLQRLERRVAALIGAHHLRILNAADRKRLQLAPLLDGFYLEGRRGTTWARVGLQREVLGRDDAAIILADALDKGLRVFEERAAQAKS